jgi:hypothetical protein
VDWNKKVRLEKILKYKNKSRNWKRNIAYDCRKDVADRRLRIKGRFISKDESGQLQINEDDSTSRQNSSKNFRLQPTHNQLNNNNSIISQ